MKNKIKLLIIILFFSSTNNLFAENNSKVDISSDNTIIPNENTSEAEDNVLKIKDVKNINKANIVVIQALNKITAKSYRYEIKIGNEINFERLIVKPLFCWKSSPEDVSENKVLLKVTELKIDRTQNDIFYGWMFSSYPGLSSIEHPMYDITIVDCKLE